MKNHSECCHEMPPSCSGTHNSTNMKMNATPPEYCFVRVVSLSKITSIMQNTYHDLGSLKRKDPPAKDPPMGRVGVADHTFLYISPSRIYHGPCWSLNGSHLCNLQAQLRAAPEPQLAQQDGLRRGRVDGAQVDAHVVARGEDAAADGTDCLAAVHRQVVVELGARVERLAAGGTHLQPRPGRRRRYRPHQRSGRQRRYRPHQRPGQPCNRAQRVGVGPPAGRCGEGCNRGSTTGSLLLRFPNMPKLQGA